MNLYKTKVEEIEAIQWRGTEKSMRDIINFVGEFKISANNVMWKPLPNVLSIIPDHCNQLDLHFNDWLIKNRVGNIKVCKSEMFNIYYEEYKASTKYFT